MGQHFTLDAGPAHAAPAVGLRLSPPMRGMDKWHKNRRHRKIFVFAFSVADLFSISVFWWLYLEVCYSYVKTSVFGFVILIVKFMSILSTGCFYSEVQMSRLRVIKFYLSISNQIKFYLRHKPEYH